MKTLTSTAPRILLVDDSKDGLLVRRTLLEEVGYTVQIAVNGEEGLKLFEAGKFDLVVTDYHMPRMDGLELIVRIRAMNPAMGVILFSGFVEPLGLNAGNTGADAVIAKSASEPAHLLRAVKRLLNRTPRKPPGSQKSTAKELLAKARASGQ
jgi:CheY-like chemotaxis protein